MISTENVILPNKPLSNFEFEDAAKRLKIPSFIGVFLLDTLPKKLNKKKCGIVKTSIKATVPARIWSLSIKTVKLKFILIATAYNLRSKLSST